MEKLALLGGTPVLAEENGKMFSWPIMTEEDYDAAMYVVKNNKFSATDITEKFQEEFAAWLNAKGLLWAHIPNERKATVVVMSELERQGMKKGFPDNFIAEPRGKYHGLFIELKRAKKSLSRKSPEQRAWIIALNAKGYAAAFCYGAEEAKRTVLKYLEEE